MQNLSDNKSASTNFVRSSKESSSAISSMINTNDATKGENDKSSQIEQIRIDKTSNAKDEETDDDNIPLNTCFTSVDILQKTKHSRNKKTKFRNKPLYYITK